MRHIYRAMRRCPVDKPCRAGSMSTAARLAPPGDPFARNRRPAHGPRLSQLVFRRLSRLSIPTAVAALVIIVCSGWGSILAPLTWGPLPAQAAGLSLSAAAIVLTEKNQPRVL